MRKNHNLHLLVQQLQRRKSKTIMSNDNGRTCGHENRIVRKKTVFEVDFKEKRELRGRKTAKLENPNKMNKKKLLNVLKEK
jgi:hypothetical protein